MHATFAFMQGSTNMQQSNGLQQRVDSQTAAPGPGSAAAAAAATGVNIVPPKKKLDAAVIYHDIFNLASILALVVLNLNFMANGNAFWVLWWATMGYFVVDIVWVVLVPHSVKGVEAIMLHHVVTTVLVFVPLYYPEYQHLMGINSEWYCLPEDARLHSHQQCQWQAQSGGYEAQAYTQQPALCGVHICQECASDRLQVLRQGTAPCTPTLSHVLDSVTCMCHAQ